MSESVDGATGVRIRQIRPDDHERVGQLTVASYAAADAEVTDDYRSQLANVTRRLGDGDVLVAVDADDRVLGSIVYVVPGDLGWEDRQPPSGDAGFRMLAVAPDSWGQGAGRALVDHCIDRARASHCRRMVITTMPTMTTAHGLYERRGFVRRPDLDVRFPGATGIVFHLDLVPDADDHFPPRGPTPDEIPWFEDVWGPDPHDSSHC